MGHRTTTSTCKMPICRAQARRTKTTTQPTCSHSHTHFLKWAPSPNSNELRESPLEADSSTNMQDDGLYGVDDEEEDHENGSNHYSPSPPFPFSTPTPESPELTPVQHRKQWIEHEERCMQIPLAKIHAEAQMHFNKTQAEVYNMFWERQLEREKRQSEWDADSC